MPPANLIEIRDLSRLDTGTGRAILNHLDLTLAAGDRVGLAGPTGSGKSSLLRAIVRLDRCQSGQVLYEGRVITGDAIPAYRRSVIYLPQRPVFVAGSVWANLELPQRLAAARAREDDHAGPPTPGLDRDQVMKWLGDFAQSQRLLDESVEALSGGEQQMVALIRAMSLQPRVLLLDEPTASLDALATQRLEELVLAWQGERDDLSTTAPRAFIWTSHDLTQLRRIANRIVHISDGYLTLEKQDG